MTKIIFTKISFSSCVEHLQGKKITPAPEKIDELEFYRCEYPHYWPWDIMKKITFFDDGTCMALVSEWDKGYYGDIDPESPLIYLGKVVSCEH